MAALTWREVAAPDTRGAMQGFSQFSELLNNALGQAREGLNRVDADISTEANNNIALAALRQQDPAAMKAALESGSILAGVDPRRVSAQTIAMLSQRPGQLLAQANQEQQLEENQYNFGQQQLTDERAPLIAQARNLAGDEKALGEFLTANPGLMDGLGYKNVREFQNDLLSDQKARQDMFVQREDNRRADTRLGYEGREQNRADARLGMEQGRYSWEKEDRDSGKAADGILASVYQNASPGNRESVRNAVFNNPAFARLNGTAQAALFARLGSAFPGWFEDSEIVTAPNGAAGGTMGGDAVQRVMGWTPRGVDGNSNASVDNKMGLIARGLGGVGVDAPLTKDQFLRQDMTALEGRAAGRNNPGNMKNKDGSWKQFNSPAEYNQAQRAWLERRWNEGARTIRDAVEGRQVGGSTTGSLASNAIRTGQDRMGKSDSGELISAAQNGPTTLAGAVGALRSDPAFAGVSSKFLNGRVQDIVDRSKVNGRPTITYGQANIILRDSMENPESLKEYAAERDKGGGLFNIYRARNPFNDQFITDEISRQSGQGLVNSNERTLRTQASAARIQTAADNLTKATQNLQSLMSRSVTQGGLNNAQGNGQSSVSLARARVAAAQTALDAARKEGDSINGQITRPVATTAGSPSTSIGGFFSELFSIRREPR